MNKETVLYGFGNWVEIHYMWIKNHFNIVGVYDQNPDKKAYADEVGWKFLTVDELVAQRYDNILLGSVREVEIKKFLVDDLKIEREILSGNQLYFEEQKILSETIVCQKDGQNPDLIFYILNSGEASLTRGLMNHFCDAIFETKKALEHGWIPVVDMKNYFTCYHDTIQQVGNVNPWEYYFEQPNDSFTLENALESQNIVYMTGLFGRWENLMAREYSVFLDKFSRKLLHDCYVKNIQLSKKAQFEYSRYKKILFDDKGDGKILSVFIRGTDYTEGKAYMHAIQPSLEQIVEKVRYAISEWGGVQSIYVNAEENKSIEYMKKAFPGLVFSMDRQLYDNYDAEKQDVIPQLKFARKDDALNRGMEYLISVLLATNCDYFIGGRNAGTMAALIMAGEYEQEYIFDLGRYGIDDDAYTYTLDGKPVYVNKRTHL